MAQALDIVIFNTIAIEVQKEKVVATVEDKVFLPHSPSKIFSVCVFCDFTQ